MFVTVFSRHSWRQSWWNTPPSSHIMLIPVISVRCWKKSRWVRLEERGGEPCSTSLWFPCGSNPLILTDKDLINTRLCNYSLIKVIWPLVWMSSQDASRRGGGGERHEVLVFMSEFNASSSKPLVSSRPNESIVWAPRFTLTTHLLFIGNAEASSGATWNGKQASYRHSPLQITRRFEFSCSTERKEKRWFNFKWLTQTGAKRVQCDKNGFFQHRSYQLEMDQHPFSWPFKI